MKKFLSNFIKFFSKKENDKTIIVPSIGERRSPSYGDELICARYFYSDDESKWVDLNIPTRGPIGVWMSGGVDSTLLTFLLAKTIKDYDLNIKILPISFKRDLKPWNLSVSTNLVDKIKNILDVNCFLNHHYCNFGNTEDPEHNKKTSRHAQWLKENKIVTIIYNGTTSYPNPLPDELNSKMESRRSSTVDELLNRSGLSENEAAEYIISMPFRFVDKKTVSYFYNKFNLLESLLPYTRSCESFMKDTDFFKKSCGECYWCKERQWAFSDYDVDALQHIRPSRAIIKACQSL